MKKYILSVDWITVLLVLSLMTIGLTAVSSASTETRKISVQFFACSLGFITMMIIAFWDYRSVKGLGNHLYFLCIFLLAIVFPLGTGKEETGAISWIRFGSVGVQPSEFVKVFFCLYLSCEFREILEQGTLNNPKKLTRLIAKSSPIIALVVLQNDTGSALVFVFILMVLLFISGLSVKYILIGIGILAVTLPLMWFLLSDYQKDRIKVFLHPEIELAGAGFQVYLSKLAISSGGIFGQGYRQGAISSLSFLPEKDTDFIFAVIGEEFGLIGTTITVLLFLLLIIRCVTVARQSSDLQGKLIATGVLALVTFHTIENIGMCMGLLPVTGIPLPFVSYGGSSVLSMSMAMGLILSVRRKTYKLHYD